MGYALTFTTIKKGWHKQNKILLSDASCSYCFSYSGWGFQPQVSGMLKNTLSAGSSVWGAGRALAGGRETVIWCQLFVQQRTQGPVSPARWPGTQQDPVAWLEIPDYHVLRLWGCKGARSLLGDSQLKLFYCCTKIKSLKGDRDLRLCCGKTRAQLVRKAWLNVRVGWAGGQEGNLPAAGAACCEGTPDPAAKTLVVGVWWPECLPNGQTGNFS